MNKIYLSLFLFVVIMETMYPLTVLYGAGNLPQTGSVRGNYQQRCNHLFAFTDSTKTENYFYVAAKLHRRQDVPAALRMLENLLNDPSASSRGMFVIYELMAAYLYGGDMIPPALTEKIRRSFAIRPLYRGDTENHWVMYYTGLYLAAQTWNGLSGDHWYTGKSSAENFTEAEGFLYDWIRTTTTIGQGEFDSPTYMIVYLAPMLILQQFAADPVLKKKAKMMVHYLLADFAAEHLQGMYCGAHSRDYPFDAVEPKHAPSTGWAWLMFGQTEPVMRPEILAAALSDYHMPELIYHIATDRSKPYIHTETKRVRNIIRFSKDRNPPVYKYDYMTKYFCLGSMQGGILQPIQEHTWDVTFVSEKPNCTLFTVHPYIGERELGMFFPEEMKFTLAEVAHFHTYYGKEDKWVSSSPYEQTFQHKNILIALYNIPGGTQFEHIDGFFPKDLDERIFQPFNENSTASRWIFCRAGKTYIAYFPLKRYRWIEEDIDWRLRSTDLKNGCIVEVASADDYPTFAAFRQQIKANFIDMTDFNAKMTVKYITSAGDNLQFTYGGQRMVNGRPLDFKSYKLFKGPFLHAEVGSGELEMTYKDEKMILDFNTVGIR